MFLSHIVEAQVNSWTDGSDKWENAVDWSLGVAPSSSDSIDYITNATTKTVTIDATTATNFPSTMAVSNLTIIGSINSTNTLFLNNAGAAIPLQILGNGLTLDTNAFMVVNNSVVVASNTTLAVGYSGGNSRLIVSNGGVLFDGYGYVGYGSEFAPNPTNDSAIISGSGSVWSNSGTLTVGNHADYNTLTVTNGGVVYSTTAGLGAGGNFNAVLVTGNGSVWNSGYLALGFADHCVGNSLTIAQGGAVESSGAEIDISTDGGHWVVVTDPGSVWRISGDLDIGNLGGGLSGLVISNGGAVYCNYALLDSDWGDSALVTDTGSVWNISGGLDVGSQGLHRNSVTIANGGAVYSNGGNVGGLGGGSVQVTGSGSVWSNSADLALGSYYGGVESMTVTEGGAVYDANAVLGYSRYGNVELVSGSGSLWNNSGNLTIVGNSPWPNQLTVTDGGAVLASNVYVSVNGFGSQTTVSGGALYVTNALGNGVFELLGGTLALSGGMVTVDSLLVMNGTPSNTVVSFTGGTLNTRGTSVSNGFVFAVGDGIDAATFELDGGVHSFASNLEISNNATLSGCGTVNGNIVVDPGGTVSADCGGTLTFTGIVTNNGTIITSSGTDIEFYGPVVNNGVIDALAGTVHFHSTFTNDGTFVDASSMRITAIANQSNDILVTWTCEGGHSYILQSTKSTAMIAEYTTNFADASPVITVPGTGPSTTNYLDVGAAYAPIVTPPGGTMVTTSTVPSTVYSSAIWTRGITDSLGQALPIGSLLMLGTFSISEPIIQSNFTAGNVSAIMSNFTPYSTSFAVGDGSSLAASWSVSRSAPGFGGQHIYLLAIDTPTLAAANHLGIYTAPSWTFPADGETNTIDLADVTDFVIGAQGGSLTIDLPVGGVTYTFDDTARLSFLPGRILFYRIRLVQ